MATIAVAQTGAWSDTATWDGGVLPGPGDDVVSTEGAIVTVDGDYTISTLTVYNRGGFVIDTNKRLTISGISTWGNATPYMSYLTMRAGSELTINGTMTIGAIQWYTEDTTAHSPAKISGTSNVAHIVTRRSDIVFRHAIIANDSTFSLAMGDNSISVITPERRGITFDHCVFLPGGKVSMLSANTSIPETRRNEILNCDVRGRSIDISGLGAVSKRVINTTFATDPALPRAEILVIGGQLSEPMRNCVFSNYFCRSQPSLDAEGNLVFQHVGVQGDSAFNLGSATMDVAARFHKNYFFSSIENTHGIGGGGTGITTENEITSNVFEVSPESTGGGNVLVYGAAKRLISRNLMISQLSNLAGSAGVFPDAQGITITRNTLAGAPSTSTLGDPLLLLTEGESAGDNYTGQEIVRSNLVASTTPVAAGSRGALVGTATDNNIWDTIGYNAVYNISGALYRGTITNDETANDITLTGDPGFYDASRNMATWGAEVVGVGTPSASATAELFLAINGYDPVVQKQTGAVFDRTVEEMVEWVRAGFAPTNAALLNAGYDGVTIGAMEYVPADDTAPVLTDATATATGPTTATASVSTDDGNGTLYFLASTNATETAAAVKAALSQSVTADGEQSVSLSALDPETTYYVHFVQINGASLESVSVVSTAAFTTDAIAVKGVTIALHAGTTPQASISNIVALWWDATTPSGEPDYSTTTASTDASGVLTLNLDATTTLSIGDSGFLLLYKLNATDHRDSLVFAGRVAVSDVS